MEVSENARVICVISEMESSKKEFLQKILAAARIPLEKYHIVILGEDEIISAADVQWFNQLEYILCIGLDPVVLDIKLPLNYYTIAELQQTKIIQLPGLHKIESDKAEKQKLWELLKNEFIND